MRRTRQAAACTGVRLNDDKRRRGALAQRARQPPPRLDVGGPEVAMTCLVGPHMPLTQTHTAGGRLHRRALD